MTDTATKDTDLNLDEVFEAEAPKTETSSVTTDEVGQPRDESGRFASKTKDVPSEEQPAPDPKAQIAPPDGEDERGSRHHVPYHEFKSERQPRLVEARVRAAAAARAAAYERQMQVILSQRQPAAPQQPVQPPDPYTDPEGFTRFHVSRAEAALSERLAFISENNARHRYGSDVVDEALQMAKQVGDPRAHFSQFPDPWDELVKWSRKHKALQKIGPDPDAYEKQIEERARAQAIADLKAGKIKLDGQPVQQKRFPGTLADQTSSSVAQTAHLSDDAMMAGVFAR
jgi:hypothetical protein